MDSGLLWWVKCVPLCLVGKTCVPLCRVLTCVDHLECRTLKYENVHDFQLHTSVVDEKTRGRLRSTFVLKWLHYSRCLCWVSPVEHSCTHGSFSGLGSNGLALVSVSNTPYAPLILCFTAVFTAQWQPLLLSLLLAWELSQCNVGRHLGSSRGCRTLYSSLSQLQLSSINLLCNCQDSINTDTCSSSLSQLRVWHGLRLCNFKLLYCSFRC